MTGARAGDNDQVIALAEALGLPFEVKQLEYNALCHLGPRLLGQSTGSLTAGSRAAISTGELPDLTISAGHRSVPIVRALRHRSGGSMRSVHVGFPRISPAHFDLVVATPQYPIPDHPNLLRVSYALTRAATANADIGDRALLADLPHPRRLLIVGGPTLFWRIDEQALLRALDDMVKESALDGGSLLVTTSPRTPPMLGRKIGEMLASADAPTLFAAPNESPSYLSLLEAADSIRVTADSVSMVSDAIWMGKPLALVPVVKSPMGRAYMTTMDRLRPGRPVYPQDLRFFWQALAEIGIGTELATAKASTGEELRKVLRRIEPLLSRR
jgi:mitochondrial fission protein ELM1